ncbi:MAG: UDP-N-acetylmuramoyl-L-alanyl-D-glutamate--2,6-diaminopimelate ligase, partial [Armatimonadota bacterium]
MHTIRRRLLWLQEQITGLVEPASGDPEVTGVAYDSRRVQPGDIFVALRGQHTDGHRFLRSAADAGAVALVVEAGADSQASALPTVRVRDTRRALAEIAAAFWDWPSRKMKVVGVTGTNGKTTTAMLVADLAEAANMKAAVLGTLGRIVGDEVLQTEHTTLEAPDLQRSFAEMLAKGIELVAMEVSSHGLVLDRVWQTCFDVGALTNISQDHLDFHKDMEDYARAKGLLFTCYADLAAGCKQMQGVLNWDDQWAQRLSVEAHCPIVSYAVERSDATVRAEDIEFGPRETTFTLVLPDTRHQVRLGLVGRFNVENALAAAAVGVALELPGEAIVRGLSAARQVPGRLERVEAGQDFLVLVDYAHTPDALIKVLTEARRLTAGRVLCVFGCGGDRDQGKRPKMGAAATDLADWTVITSDNPRTENPEAIISAILVGAREGRYETCVDRREAIHRAIDLAQPGDVVVIAGKGHEDYQLLGDRTIHFDDREEARAAILARRKVRWEYQHV